MQTDNRVRPSTAETLGAVYGDDWIIWRDVLPGGGHGMWVAQSRARRGGQLSADTIDGLAALLDAAEAGL